MPKFPLFSLLTALAVISSFSMAAVAEDMAPVAETSVSSHTATQEEHHVATPSGESSSVRAADHSSTSVKVAPAAAAKLGGVKADLDADMTVDDEE